MGSVYRLDPDGDVATVLTGVTISNGLSFAPDGRSAWYVDTPTDRVDRLEVDPAMGTIIRRCPIVEHVDPGHPDGIAVDVEGGVWAALWDGSGVNRYDAQGRLTDVVRLPCSPGDLPGVRRAGPAGPLRHDVPPWPARGRAAGGRRALPAPPGGGRHAGPALRGLTPALLSPHGDHYVLMITMRGHPSRGGGGAASA